MITLCQLIDIDTIKDDDIATTVMVIAYMSATTSTLTTCTSIINSKNLTKVVLDDYNSNDGDNSN